MTTRQLLPMTFALLAGIGFLPSAVADGAHDLGSQAVIHAVTAQGSYAPRPVGGRIVAASAADISITEAAGGSAAPGGSHRVIVTGLELYMHAPR